MAAMNWEYEMTELTPQSIHRVARWLAEHGYDELYKCEKTEAAREKRDLEQHAAIVRCYPERVRKVFDDLVKAADDGGEDDRDTDDAQDFSDKAAQVVIDPRPTTPRPRRRRCGRSLPWPDSESQ